MRFHISGCTVEQARLATPEKFDAMAYHLYRALDQVAKEHPLHVMELEVTFTDPAYSDDTIEARVELTFRPKQPKGHSTDQIDN